MARGWLAVWVLALGVQCLQPCCEAIAHSLPHDHETPAHTHFDSGEVSGHDHSPPDHDHCAGNDGLRLQPAPVPAVAGFDSPDRPAAVPAPFDPFPQRQAGQGPVAAQPAFGRLQHPPPYLSTLRLRL